MVVYYTEYIAYQIYSNNCYCQIQINQRMMKSAMIKDLYYEIDRLKQGSSTCKAFCILYAKYQTFLIHLFSMCFQRYLLQERRMVYIFRESATSKRKLKKRFTLVFELIPYLDLFIHITEKSFILKKLRLIYF
jgi:kinesin family member 11